MTLSKHVMRKMNRGNFLEKMMIQLKYERKEEENK